MTTIAEYTIYARWATTPNSASSSQSAPVPGGNNIGYGTTTISSNQNAAGQPTPSYSTSQTDSFTQRFHWSGTGTPTTSFTVPGSGTLQGQVIVSGAGYGNAVSTVNFPGGTSQWSFLGNGTTAKHPSGNIAVWANGTAASFTWSLQTTAYGGPAYARGGSYISQASATYAIGTPNP